MKARSSNKVRKSELSRKRRSLRTKRRIAEQGAVRLTVHRTPCHIYAQVIDNGKVLAAASSLDKELRTKDLGPGKIKMAEEVGCLVAERAQVAGVTKVAFDRSGFKYHGRIKALADGARGKGLQF